MLHKMKNNLYLTIYIILSISIIFYLSVLSSEKYDSSTTISVVYNQASSLSSSVSNPLALLNGMSKSNDLLRDIKSLELFLSSPIFFNKLNEKFNLKKIYSSSKYSNFYEKVYNKKYIENYISRFNSDFTFYYEPDFNVIYLDFMFPEKEKSQEILTFIVQQLENKLNDLNEIQINLQSKFVKKEVNTNLELLNKVKSKLFQLQNTYKILDPNFNLEEKLKRISKAKSEYEQNELVYQNTKNILSSKNPKLIKMKNKLHILHNYYHEVYNEVYNNNKLNINAKSLNKILITFKELEKTIEMRNELYLISLKKYENLKFELLQKNKLLEIITRPTKPEQPSFPYMPVIIPTLLIMLAIIMFIIKSIIAIIEEHNV